MADLALDFCAANRAENLNSDRWLDYSLFMSNDENGLLGSRSPEERQLDCLLNDTSWIQSGSSLNSNFTEGQTTLVDYQYLGLELESLEPLRQLVGNEVLEREAVSLGPKTADTKQASTRLRRRLASAPIDTGDFIETGSSPAPSARVTQPNETSEKSVSTRIERPKKWFFTASLQGNASNNLNRRTNQEVIQFGQTEFTLTEDSRQRAGLSMAFLPKVGYRHQGDAISEITAGPIITYNSLSEDPFSLSVGAALRLYKPVDFTRSFNLSSQVNRHDEAWSTIVTKAAWAQPLYQGELARLSGNLQYENPHLIDVAQSYSNSWQAGFLTQLSKTLQLPISNFEVGLGYYDSFIDSDTHYSFYAKLTDLYPLKSINGASKIDLAVKQTLHSEQNLVFGEHQNQTEVTFGASVQSSLGVFESYQPTIIVNTGKVSSAVNINNKAYFDVGLALTRKF